MANAMHHPSAESSPIRNIMQRAGLEPQPVGPSHWLARYWTQPSGCYDFETCCMALYLPGVLYGKSLWRLEQRARGLDSSNNAWQIQDSFNRNCAMFFVFGMLFPIIPPLMAGLQRTQIRGTYSIDGTVTGDMFLGLLCPVCTLAQNDREIRARESDTRLQNSARLNGRTFPIQTQPRKQPAMVYTRQNEPLEAISMAILPDEKRQSKGLTSESTRKTPEGQAEQSDTHVDQQSVPKADFRMPELTAKKESVGRPDPDPMTVDYPSVIVACSYEPKPSSSQKRGDRSYVHDFSDSPVDKSVLLFFEKQANLENQQRLAAQQKRDERDRAGQEQIDKILNLAPHKSESESSEDRSEQSISKLTATAPNQGLVPEQHDGPACQRVLAEPSEPINIFERAQPKLEHLQNSRIAAQHSLGSCAVQNSTTEAGHTLANCATHPARAVEHLHHDLEDCGTVSSSQQLGASQHGLENCPTARPQKENTTRSEHALEDCEAQPSWNARVLHHALEDCTPASSLQHTSMTQHGVGDCDPKPRDEPWHTSQYSRRASSSAGSSLAIRSLRRIGQDPKAGGANTLWGK